MMKGADRYAEVFKTGQYGRLYIVAHHHARGRTFQIYILPEGVEEVANCVNGPQGSKNAVEVYGIVSGNPGWTEEYGWLHEGPWQADFYALLQEHHEDYAAARAKERAQDKDRRIEDSRVRAALLSTYGGRGQ